MIRGRTTGALVTLTVLVLAGCSGEEKNYAVPEKLCGAQVSPELTENLLPSGDEIRVVEEESNTSSPHQFCRILVDDKVELSTEGAWQPAGTTAKEAAEKSLVFGTQATEGGKFAIGERRAVTVVDCKNSKYKAERFSVELEVNQPEGEVGEKMQSFLSAFSESYLKTLPCGS
ncbi:hypothetical protein ACF1G3_38945 [Streptomyces rochei]|uniref:hypothetical protein n=1 Tax=Streptomyces rochei TaxID=1928 RepID=UPI003701009D